MPERCSRCGAELPRHLRGGQCLHCLLQLGLTPGEAILPAEGCLPAEPVPVVDGVAAEQPGTRLGRFLLLKQIGCGGFGVVFLAEQQEPVRRRVALKVVKAGLVSPEATARFAAERQTLALMDHPNIAKVLDGGTTPAGQPYLVMELIAGRPITEYCDAHRLSIAARLGIFVQVCEAVHHAHQKGIIHCDLKPSNILVSRTDPDQPAMAKVIDFGVAKASLGQRLTAQSRHTVLRQFAGTRAYMSPEQAGMGGVEVDARSDIYSLGMLLYELLTAQPAFDPAELQYAAVDEVYRIIGEKDPLRPSTKLAMMEPGRLQAIAQSRQTEPAKLRASLKDDLDWIVMKALEKDRNRRYQTANGLAMDVCRHLNLAPVLARPPSRLYRLKKLVRRNKSAAAGAAAALSLTLLLSVVVSSCRTLVTPLLPKKLALPSTVAAWGNNSYGQTSVPADLTNAVAIAAGEKHSLALRADGVVVGWGRADRGQLDAPPGLSNVIAVSAGDWHSLALKSDGTLVGWGDNSYGQTAVPAALSNVVAIAAGPYHCVALRSNGTVVGWGWNADGQIAVPAGSQRIVGIAAGYGHGLALQADGTVIGWGRSSEGQLDVPAGLRNVVAIAAGRYHSLALKADGTVVAWGDNSHGQVNVPLGLRNVVAIAGGEEHSLALRGDGVVVGWGRNVEGQLITPAAPGKVVAIAAGSQHGLALVSSGSSPRFRRHKTLTNTPSF